jgi:hypothetical protein
MSKSKGTGWYDFSGCIIAIIGVSLSISGFQALFRKEIFSTESLLFGSMQFWAWVWLGLGLLSLVTASALFGGGGRILGIVIASLAAISTLLTYEVAGQHSLARLLLTVLVIYGLTTHGDVGGGGEMLSGSIAPGDRVAPPPIR